MARILSEDQIKKRLTEKRIDRKSYQKSFGRDDSAFTFEDVSDSELMAKQVSTLEKILAEMVSILKEIPQDRNLLVENLGKDLKEGFGSLAKMISNPRTTEHPVKLPGKWKFKIHRDSQGRIESVGAEPEDNNT
jgi:hypothetical protein